MNVELESLRKHCNTTPKIKWEYYPNTKYKLYRIVCPVCGVRTGAKANIRLAVQEWEHPFTVKLN